MGKEAAAILGFVAGLGGGLARNKKEKKQEARDDERHKAYMQLIDAQLRTANQRADVLDMEMERARARNEMITPEMEAAWEIAKNDAELDKLTLANIGQEIQNDIGGFNLETLPERFNMERQQHTANIQRIQASTNASYAAARNSYANALMAEEQLKEYSDPMAKMQRAVARAMEMEGKNLDLQGKRMDIQKGEMGLESDRMSLENQRALQPYVIPQVEADLDKKKADALGSRMETGQLIDQMTQSKLANENDAEMQQLAAQFRQLNQMEAQDPTSPKGASSRKMFGTSPLDINEFKTFVQNNVGQSAMGAAAEGGEMKPPNIQELAAAYVEKKKEANYQQYIGGEAVPDTGLGFMVTSPFASALGRAIPTPSMSGIKGLFGKGPWKNPASASGAGNVVVEAPASAGVPPLALPAPGQATLPKQFNLPSHYGSGMFDVIPKGTPAPPVAPSYTGTAARSLSGGNLGVGNVPPPVARPPMTNIPAYNVHGGSLGVGNAPPTPPFIPPNQAIPFGPFNPSLPQTQLQNLSPELLRAIGLIR